MAEERLDHWLAACSTANPSARRRLSPCYEARSRRSSGGVYPDALCPYGYSVGCGP
jgi:hypothetical protein